MIDELILRTRDCNRLAAILNSAGESERRWVGRGIANLLAALPGAQAELAPQGNKLPHLEDLVRRVGMLESVMLELARGARGLRT